MHYMKNIFNKDDIMGFIIKTIIFICALMLIGIMILCVIYFDNIAEFISRLMVVVNPFICGMIIAYLLKPLYNKMYSIQCKKVKRSEKKCRILALLYTETLFVIVIITICSIIIPQSFRSVTDLIKVMPDALDSTQDWIDSQVDNNALLRRFVGDNLEDLQGKFSKFIKESVIPNMDSFASNIATYVKDIVVYIADILIGVVISIFVLASKDSFKINVKRIMLAIFGKKLTLKIIDELRVADRMFSGFFLGKIIDSLIVGVICFIVLSIFKMPYTLLLSVIVCITNIVPIIGPFIGAIPGIIIVLSVSPIQALEFAIFILILQQIDGHIIGPKCIGSATGLNTFWVLFSIIVFGGIWGVAGMIIGVPLMAVIHDIVNKLVTCILNKRNISEKDI